MTVDDDNSIYVGGLPYSATEDSVRRIFSFYGAVIAVKIINDQSKRGKCYGFVTFRHPRPVDDAIEEMDAKTIDGRVVRVNGVTTRVGRPGFGQQRFRHDMGRSMEWERGKGREREYERDRDRQGERYSDRSRERDRSLDYDEDRERAYQHARYHDRARGAFLDEDQYRDRSMPDDEHDQGRNLDLNGDSGDHVIDSDEGRDLEGSNGMHRYVERDTDRHSRGQNGYDDQHKRELSSTSDDYYEDDVKDNLERSEQKYDELKKEISQMEAMFEDKQLLVSDLQKEAMELEDALQSAKRIYLHRKMQLTQLHKCFRQVREYTERLKSSEHELQVSLFYLNDFGRRKAISFCYCCAYGQNFSASMLVSIRCIPKVSSLFCEECSALLLEASNKVFWGCIHSAQGDDNLYRLQDTDSSLQNFDICIFGNLCPLRNSKKAFIALSST